jgi:hypothetical protein
VSEILGRRPRTNRRCSETLLSEASDEVGRWASSLTRLAGDPARGSLASRPFVDLSLKWGGRVIFHHNLGIPNCGTRHNGSMELMRLLPDDEKYPDCLPHA